MHRFFRFSLRAMLIGTLLFGLLMGVVVTRAERQRAAVAAIDRLGGTVYYEDGAPHRGTLASKPADRPPRLVERLAEILGKDYFYGVERFLAYPEAAEDCLPYLGDLHGLRQVTICTDNGMLQSELKLAENVEQRIQRMLPDCDVEQDMVYLCIGPLD